MTDQITTGFLPLTDSAILVAAREFGFARQEGIDLHLVRETSWASIRDRMAVGHFDAAHQLAPMPVAANLGLTQLSLNIIVPFALGFGGNAVTMALPIWQEMVRFGADTSLDPKSAGQALRDVITERKTKGKSKLQLAVVHPFSAHNYELRYWLRACGIDPHHDVDIVIVPPPLMADALAAGRIDGYCVGEPWNSLAVERGIGAIVTVKAKVWSLSPEKVLGLRADWAEANPELTDRLIKSLYKAAQWCGDPANASDLAEALSNKAYLGLPQELITPALTGRIAVGRQEERDIADFFVPFAHDATSPKPIHALWFYSQMIQCGQITATAGHAATAAGTYRPDIYYRAIGSGHPTQKDQPAVLDGFFDGHSFDPTDIGAYLAKPATE